jgi:hypothetical protein
MTLVVVAVGGGGASVGTTVGDGAVTTGTSCINFLVGEARNDNSKPFANLYDSVGDSLIGMDVSCCLGTPDRLLDGSCSNGDMAGPTLKGEMRPFFNALPWRANRSIDRRRIGTVSVSTSCVPMADAIASASASGRLDFCGNGVDGSDGLNFSFLDDNVTFSGVFVLFQERVAAADGSERRFIDAVVKCVTTTTGVIGVAFWIFRWDGGGEYKFGCGIGVADNRVGTSDGPCNFWCADFFNGDA